MQLAQTMANTILNAGADVYVEPLALAVEAVLEAVAVVHSLSTHVPKSSGQLLQEAPCA